MAEASLIIDGDYLVFEKAASVEDRVHTVHAAGVPVQSFTYKKDAVEFANYHGMSVEDITLEIFPGDIQTAQYLVEQEIDNAYAVCEQNGIVVSGHVVVFGGADNFRYKLYPDYKANRKDLHRPHHLKELREYVLCNHPGSVFNGMEGDDAIGVVMDPGSIVMSNDKDLDQLPGRHYNWRRNSFYTMSGSEALASLYRQGLTGDSTDNIPGIRGLGPKTAQKLVDPSMTESTMWNIVVNEWLKANKGRAVHEVVSELIRTMNLVFTLRSAFEKWVLPDWDTNVDETILDEYQRQGETIASVVSTYYQW